MALAGVNMVLSLSVWAVCDRDVDYIVAANEGDERNWPGMSRCLLSSSERVALAVARLGLCMCTSLTGAFNRPC
jgi:hypothetical protein